MGRPLQQARWKVGGNLRHRRRHGGRMQLRLGAVGFAHDRRHIRTLRTHQRSYIFNQRQTLQNKSLVQRQQQHSQTQTHRHQVQGIMHVP